MTFALAVLVASLLGSVHCAAMCGAFSCLYASPGASWRATRGAHAAYHGGRLAAYLSLGAIGGSLGAGLDAMGAFAGVREAATLASAVLLVAWGAHALLVARGARLGTPAVPAGWQGAMARGLERMGGRSPAARAAATGLCTALLPCGWLYAFVVTAAGTGSPLRGAATMGVFWAGTVPLLLAAAVGVQRATGRLRAHLPTLAASAVLCLGLLSLALHLGLLPSGPLHRALPPVPVADGGSAASSHSH